MSGEYISNFSNDGHIYMSILSFIKFLEMIYGWNAFFLSVLPYKYNLINPIYRWIVVGEGGKYGQNQSNFLKIVSKVDPKLKNICKHTVYANH